MTAFKNLFTGTTMYVHESREAEYEAAGHIRLAHKPAETEPVQENKPAGTKKSKAGENGGGAE